MSPQIRLPWGARRSLAIGLVGLVLGLIPPRPAEAQFFPGLTIAPESTPSDEHPRVPELITWEADFRDRYQLRQEQRVALLGRLDSRRQTAEQQADQLSSRYRELGARRRNSQDRLQLIAETLAVHALLIDVFTEIEQAEEQWLDELLEGAVGMRHLQLELDALPLDSEDLPYSEAQQALQNAQTRHTRSEVELVKARNDEERTAEELGEARREVQEQRAASLVAEEEDLSSLIGKGDMLDDAEIERLELTDQLKRLRRRVAELRVWLANTRLRRAQVARERAEIRLTVGQDLRSHWAVMERDVHRRESSQLWTREPARVGLDTAQDSLLALWAQGTSPAVALTELGHRLAEDGPSSPITTGLTVSLGFFGLLLGAGSWWLRPRLRQLQPRGVLEELLLRCSRAIVPLVPIAGISLVLLMARVLPQPIVPLTRFMMLGPALAAALLAAFRVFLGLGERRGMRASAARYLRTLVRIGLVSGLTGFYLISLLPVVGLGDETRQLLVTLTTTLLLLAWLGVLVQKRELLAAFGVSPDEKERTVIQRSFSRLYPLLGLGPLTVYLLYTAGFRALARSLTQGGIVTIGVLLLAPWAWSASKEGAQRALGYPRGGGWLSLSEEAAVTAYRATAPLLLALVATLSGAALVVGWGQGSLLENLTGALDYTLISAGGSQITIGSLPKLVAIVGITFTSSRWLVRLLREEIYPLYDLDSGTQANLDTVIGYFLLAVGLLVGLQAVGVGFGFLAVFAGVATVAIGFGSQQLASNFISGLILLATRPIAVGDVIEVAGVQGRVKRISSYSTVVRTLDNMTVVVPNSSLVTSALSNWSAERDLVRLNIGVGVAYGSDVDLVRQLLMRAALETPGVLKSPRPAVVFDSFGDSSLDFTLLPWIRDPSTIRTISSQLRYRIEVLFREGDIEMPFPQQDLHLRTADDAFIRAVGSLTTQQTGQTAEPGAAAAAPSEPSE